jgi:hypothetical protein
MNPIFSPSTHPIQPNNVEITSASRFFKRFPSLLSMLPGHRPMPRRAYGAGSIPLTICCASQYASPEAFVKFLR